MKMKFREQTHAHCLLCPHCGADKLTYEGVLVSPHGMHNPVFSCSRCCADLRIEIEQCGPVVHLWIRDTTGAEVRLLEERLSQDG